METKQHETETVPLGDRFEPVPGIAKIRTAMLKNEVNRETVSFAAPEPFRLTTKHLDAIHEIVSSLLFAEAHGGVVHCNLSNRIPYRDISEAFTVQMLDESHHTWLLTRYVREVLHRPILPAPLVARSAIWQVARLRDPLIAVMAASHFGETAAAEVLRELVAKVDEPRLVGTLRIILRDEARHVALGRDTVRFLLETPRYRAGWRRERAKLYRYFLEFFSGQVLGRFREAGAAFGVDVDAIRRITLEKVRDAAPF